MMMNNDNITTLWGGGPDPNVRYMVQGVFEEGLKAVSLNVLGIF